jgi:hypothetical protein
VSGAELKDAVEEQAAAPRAATVEAEHELVQVAIQVGYLDRALVGAEHPSLDQGGEPVDAG